MSNRGGARPGAGRKRKQIPKMKTSISLSKSMMLQIDELVHDGESKSRNAFIRDAIATALEQYDNVQDSS